MSMLISILTKLHEDPGFRWQRQVGRRRARGIRPSGRCEAIALGFLGFRVRKLEGFGVSRVLWF